jgi:misacylated tRNA(Ala) deacylase
VKIDDGFDLCPCAGTHVRQLGEIGNIQILGKKSKGKGTQRISYDLGQPAITITPNQDVVV